MHQAIYTLHTNEFGLQLSETTSSNTFFQIVLTIAADVYVTSLQA
jgi:hypothetical protein